MVVDKETLHALKQAISALEDPSVSAMPADVLAPLARVARPGLRLHLDLDASEAIGAPLVAVTDRSSQDHLLSTLTARQKQVALLIIEGLPNKTIADRLEISVATVKDHVHAILTRLQLPSRAALISLTRP